MFILIIIFAFICEFIDSSLGMGYGTILSPLLIILGFPPMIVVPSILVTQAAGGITASFFHHKHGNGNLSFKNHKLSDDLKTVGLISSFGVIATIAATIIAVNISKNLLNTYIGILVLAMGILLLLNFKFVYSYKRMFLVGAISAFNKGLSGGGYGPVVTGGQIILGKDNKPAIACTTAAEPLICMAGFISYLILGRFSSWSLAFLLGIGAIAGGILGPYFTKKINDKQLRIIVSVLLILLGSLTLLKTFGLIAIKISI